MTDEDRISEDARDWYLRLSEGGVSRRERRAFETWRRADPAHAAAYAEIEAAMGALSASFAPRSRRWPIVVLSAAACVAVLIAPDILLRLEADYTTPVGVNRSIALPDGGVAHLNTNSALALRYVPGRREVALLRGEAVFDVVSDPGRPFTVSVEGGKATATGTVYSVRLDEHVTVSVLEGTVVVSSADEERVLRAGETSAYTQGASPSVSRPLDTASLAWRNGFLVFDNVPLPEAVAEIDRYLPGISIVTGPASGAAVAGQIAIDAPSEGLTATAATAGAQVTWITPYLRLIR
ncbi:FecR family protein [Algihabitans sp.]|uniref:FecR family protein n=1 Tax=Algihabitans sp. TaxID=2821514 RepID=UPI003BAAE334